MFMISCVGMTLQLCDSVLVYMHLTFHIRYQLLGKHLCYMQLIIVALPLNASGSKICASGTI